MTLSQAVSDSPENIAPIQLRQATKEDITFLMVGCQRCGSTWLYEALKEHPEIYLPKAKQTHYFDESHENGMDWYLAHFEELGANHKAIGEVATSYCLPDVIPRVAGDLPDVKIIMAMRNPVERAYSFYRSRAPHEDWKNFQDALDKDPEIISRGQYIDQIEVLLKSFDQNQILFLFYDDLKTDERSYLRQVYTFLGVNPTFQPKVIGNPLRAAMFPRLRRFLLEMGLTPVVNLVNKSWVGDGIRRTLKKKKGRNRAPERIPEKIRQELSLHFAPFNNRLAEYLQRDLGSWDK